MSNLKTEYNTNVIPKLKQEFNYSNVGDISLTRASNKSKLIYIKNTEFRYLINDYYDYIDSGSKLIIDGE